MTQNNNLNNMLESSFIDTFTPIFTTYKTNKLLDANLPYNYFKQAETFYAYLKQHPEWHLKHYQCFLATDLNQTHKLDKKNPVNIHIVPNMILVTNLKTGFTMPLTYKIAYELFTFITKQLHEPKASYNPASQIKPHGFHKHKNGIYRDLKKKFPKTKIKGKQHKYYYSKHNK